MNSFEFDKTMECFGFQESIYYRFGLLKIYHDGRYFSVVEGKTPYELALMINKKYDNSIYKIRVNGYNELLVPSDDVYIYHIDTIEGLVIFLMETRNYYSKMKDNSLEFESILNMVYSKILEAVNPRISILEWMLGRETRKDYFKTLLAMDSYLDFRLRKKIEKFDSMINPYSSYDLELKNNGFIIRGNKDKKQEYTSFSLIDRNSGVEMTAIRDKDGFVNKLAVSTNFSDGIIVYHYFDSDGEKIAFENYDELGFRRIEYNLTYNSFGDHYGVKHKIGVCDKKLIIQKLDECISLLNTVIMKNMGYNLSSKKKILEKK